MHLVWMRSLFFWVQISKKHVFFGGEFKMKGRSIKKNVNLFGQTLPDLKGFFMRCCTVLVFRSCKKSWLCDFCHGLQPRSRADGAAILPFCCPTGLRENLLMLLILFYQHVVPVKFQMSLLCFLSNCCSDDL